ncbi:MAG: DUF2059 domain-containing protein [Ahrensia sp.]
MISASWIARSALGVALMAGAFSPAVAQELSESHLAAARAAMNSIGATDSYDALLPVAAERLVQQLIGNNPDLGDEITTFVSEEAINLASRRADLEREAALAYARAFREEDLTAIANFYTSDAGQALLSNGPIVTREVESAAAIWLRGIERDLAAAVNGRLSAANLRATPAPEDGVAAEGATAN